MDTGKRRESIREKEEIGNHLNIPQIFDFEYQTMFYIQMNKASTGPPLECTTFRGCVETSSEPRAIVRPRIRLSTRALPAFCHQQR
jgi:hypothetical protein